MKTNKQNTKEVILNEFHEWLEANELPILEPFELLNTQSLNAIQRAKVWAVIQLLN